MQKWLKDLLKVKDTPESWARGIAIGWFFGVSIFWGLQILLAIGVSHLFRGNKVVAGAMTALSNPFTTLPLYSLSYLIGHPIVHDVDPHIDFSVIHSVEGFLAAGPKFLLAMFIGTTILGAAGSVILYFTIRMYKKETKRD